MNDFIQNGVKPIQSQLETVGYWFVHGIILPIRRSAPRYTWLTRANSITIARMLLVIPIVYGVLNHKGYAFWLFIIAAISDLFDGWVAQHDGPTRLGKLLDSSTDKVLIVLALASLLYLNLFPWWFDIVVVTAIVLDMLGLYANLINFLRNRISAPVKVAAKATYRVGARFGTLPGKIKFWSLCVGTSALLLAYIVWPEYLLWLQYLGFFAIVVAIVFASMSLRQKLAW